MKPETKLEIQTTLITLGVALILTLAFVGAMFLLGSKS